jgi:succinate dehydrogenase / fumarate reductase cytochrome b subunit
MAASGLALVGFLASHLAANVLLYLPDGLPYNTYVKNLHGLGPLLAVAEVGLLGLFVLHMAVALKLHFAGGKQRGRQYKVGQTSKGGASKYNFSSVYMIVSGLVLGLFLVMHVAWFRFEIGVTGEYMTMVDGVATRDLYRLVVDSFKNPVMAGVYTAVMLFLGVHLRHGFWSAFQSLGMMAPKYTKPIYALGILIAISFAGGFLGIPFFIYFTK